MTRAMRAAYLARAEEVLERSLTPEVTAVMAKNAAMRFPRPMISPLVQGFRDNYWVLHSPLTYVVGTSGDSMVIPAGFVTDFASIPKRAQGVFSPTGPYSAPAVLHDWLYWTRKCSREEADGLFARAMQETETPNETIVAFFVILDGKGGAAWDSNAIDRKNGLPRVLPESLRQPRPLEGWVDYRRYLSTRGLRPEKEPQGTWTAQFCSRGWRLPWN